MIARSRGAVLGVVMTGLLSLPLLTTAFAAPPKKKAPPKKPPAAAKGDPKAGKTAFTAEGCSGCHSTKDIKGGATSLATVAKGHDAKFIANYIQHPKKGSIMPAYKADTAEKKKALNNMVAYLLTQK